MTELDTRGDLEWYRTTGRCGGCGEQPTGCACNGWCGCWVEHARKDRE